MKQAQTTDLSRQQGSMMMNLVVSLGIIALLSAISIPNLRDFRKSSELNNATRELVSNIRYAQQLTITEQITHGVVLYGVGHYQVVRLNPATSTLRTIVLPADIAFGGISGLSGNFIRFNSYGSVQEDGVIELINASGSIKTIEVKPSGYVNSQ